MKPVTGFTNIYGVVRRDFLLEFTMKIAILLIHCLCHKWIVTSSVDLTYKIKASRKPCLESNCFSDIHKTESIVMNIRKLS